MKAFLTLLLLGSVALGCRTQKSVGQSANSSKALAGWEAYGERVQVTCKPAYYLREHDRCLVPADEVQMDFSASGIVLAVVEPNSLTGKVVAFHFDFPEKWNSWYKPDVLYVGTIAPAYIGRLGFMCDPGWHAASTNRLSGAPDTESGRKPNRLPLRRRE